MHRDALAAAHARIDALERELADARSVRPSAAFDELYGRLRSVRTELEAARAENAELRERLTKAARERLMLEQRIEHKRGGAPRRSQPRAEEVLLGRCSRCGRACDLCANVTES